MNMDDKNNLGKYYIANNLWMRHGIKLQTTLEETNAILFNADTTVLRSVLNSGRWYIDGDSYIPDNVSGGNREFELYMEEGCFARMEFDK